MVTFGKLILPGLLIAAGIGLSYFAAHRSRTSGGPKAPGVQEAMWSGIAFLAVALVLLLIEFAA